MSKPIPSEMVGVAGVVLFDGECHLCDGAVQFLLRQDRHRRLLFASLQSEAAKRLAPDDAAPAGEAPKSMIFVEEGRIYRESTAVLRILKHLGGVWSWLAILQIIPRPLRNSLYRLIARNRYRWFGKKETCWIPTAEYADRFLTR